MGFKIFPGLQIPQYRILLLLFTHGNPKSQKYFIGAVEKLIEVNKDQLLAKVPMIFKVSLECHYLKEFGTPHTLVNYSLKIG